MHTAIGCSQHGLCLPPATRQQGRSSCNQDSGPAKSALQQTPRPPPPQSSTFKRDAASPTALVADWCHHDFEPRITGWEPPPLRRILRLSCRQLASSCQPSQPDRTDTDTDTDLDAIMQRSSHAHGSVIASNQTLRTARCSIEDVASVMALRGSHSHSPGSGPWAPLSAPRHETTAQPHRHPKPINTSRHKARLQKHDQSTLAFTHTNALPAW